MNANALLKNVRQILLTELDRSEVKRANAEMREKNA